MNGGEILFVVAVTAVVLVGVAYLLRAIGL